MQNRLAMKAIMQQKGNTTFDAKDVRRQVQIYVNVSLSNLSRSEIPYHRGAGTTLHLL